MLTFIIDVFLRKKPIYRFCKLSVHSTTQTEHKQNKLKVDEGMRDGQLQNGEE